MKKKLLIKFLFAFFFVFFICFSSQNSQAVTISCDESQWFIFDFLGQISSYNKININYTATAIDSPTLFSWTGHYNIFDEITDSSPASSSYDPYTFDPTGGMALYEFSTAALFDDNYLYVELFADFWTDTASTTHENNIDIILGARLYNTDTGGSSGLFIGTLTSPNNPVPEPSTMLLLGIGLVGLAGIRRKLKK